MRRPIPVHEGEPGLAATLNRIMDRCVGVMAEDVDGGLTDADTVWPSEILKIIEGGFE